jgi:hypothetical protein
VGVNVIARGAPPSAFKSEEHAADEGVNGRFAGFISAVDYIESVGKCQIAVVKFTESVDM